MTHPEPSYLALGDEAWMIEESTASVEAQVLTHDVTIADILPAGAFTGNWLSSERVTVASEFADAALAHARACTAPVARSEEVSAAYKRAFLVLKRLSEATAAALCGQACEVEWCDDDGGDDGDDATEPFASLLFRGGPLDGPADDGGAGQLLETAETDGHGNAQALQREPGGELLNPPDAFDGEGAPPAVDLDASAAQRSSAPDRPPPSSRSCRASCPTCQHRHKLRIAFCEPPEAAKVLVPYRCVKCSRAFGLVLSAPWP